VVFCNRVGVDESISFWGGSEVVDPSGRAIFRAPMFDEGLFTVDVPLGDVRRERISLPVLRDERPELMVRELDRVVAERAGLADDPSAASVDGRAGAVGEIGRGDGTPTRPVERGEDTAPARARESGAARS
jgi:hypothetical protein